ncbi:MAG: tetratricopeptide repeat protein, partial [Planctomycetes bacterium]|nr:tetratricopeptide repeat protein [Planctomycetota bacterium]
RRYLDGKSINAQISVGRRIRARARAYRRKLVAVAVIAAFAVVSSIAAIAIYEKREVERNAIETERTAQAVLGVTAFVRLAERDVLDRNIDRAKEALLAAVELSDAIPATDPEAHRPVYTAYHDLADLAFRQKDLESALKYSEKAIDIVDTMRREFPADQLWFRLEGFSHKLRGRIAYAQDDWPTALDHFESMLEVRDELLSGAPSLVGHQIEVVNAFAWVGKAARHNGQLAYAIEIFNRAVEINTGIAGDYPGDVVHQVRLSRSENDLGVALMSQHTTYGNADAKKWLTPARARLSALLDANSLGTRKNDATDLLAQINHNLKIINRVKNRVSGDAS